MTYIHVDRLYRPTTEDIQPGCFLRMEYLVTGNNDCDATLKSARPVSQNLKLSSSLTTVRRPLSAKSDKTLCRNKAQVSITAEMA